MGALMATGTTLSVVSSSISLRALELNWLTYFDISNKEI